MARYQVIWTGDDENGYTYYPAISVMSGSNLTLQNVQIDGNTYCFVENNGTLDLSESTLSVNEYTCKNSPWGTSGGTGIKNSGTATLNDVTFSVDGGVYAVQNNSGATINVYGTDFDVASYGGYGIYNSGTANLLGDENYPKNTFTASGTGVCSFKNDGGEATITETVFEEKEGATVTYQELSPICISGGTAELTNVTIGTTTDQDESIIATITGLTAINGAKVTIYSGTYYSKVNCDLNKDCFTSIAIEGGTFYNGDAHIKLPEGKYYTDSKDEGTPITQDNIGTVRDIICLSTFLKNHTYESVILTTVKTEETVDGVPIYNTTVDILNKYVVSEKGLAIPAVASVIMDLNDDGLTLEGNVTVEGELTLMSMLTKVTNKKYTGHIYGVTNGDTIKGKFIVDGGTLTVYDHFTCYENNSTSIGNDSFYDNYIEAETYTFITE